MATAPVPVPSRRPAHSLDRAASSLRGQLGESIGSVQQFDTPQKLFHATMTIPVEPGPMTLLYPQWIPGEHGPTGTLEGLSGIIITADGKRIPWRRDLTDMFTLRLDVPAARAAE